MKRQEVTGRGWGYLNLEQRKASEKLHLYENKKNRKVIAMKISEKEYSRQREQQMQMS